MMTQRWGQLFDAAFLRQLEQLTVASKRTVHTPSAGGRRSHRLGDGLEFADHRDYAPGDNVRFVDWRYFARMDRLLTRLFHEHREGGLAILLDRSASMAGPAAQGPASAVFRRALRVSAILAYVALVGHERLWLCPYAEALEDPFRTAHRREDIVAVMDVLAEVTPGGRADLPGAVRRYLGLPSHPSAVIIISDLLDVGDGLGDALAMLSLAGCDTSVLHVTDAELVGRIGDGPVELVDAETQRALSCSASEALGESYRQQLEACSDACRGVVTARGGVYVEAPLDQPLDELVLLSLRRGGVLVGQ